MGKVRYLTLVGVLSLLVSYGYTDMEDLGLLNKDLADVILHEISGERALDYVRILAGYDRVTASREYDSAAESVLRILQKLGVKDSFIEVFPLEWSSNYYMPEKPRWWPIRGWSVKKATLSIVQPQKKIADYDEEPISLARMSRSFNGRAELVFVGTGTAPEDYKDTDVRGKIVLARGAAGAVHRMAVLQKDAIGVVSFGTSSYNRMKGRDYPDMIVWQVLSPVENEERKPQFAFSISEKQGQYLLRLLAQQKKVEVDVDIESEFYINEVKIVQALIPGAEKRDEEFLLYAHLDHVKPSAGDNASGCALLIEIADTLNRLIQQKRIPQPERSIRFVWGPEGPGSLMYINAHKKRLNKTWAGLNCDMVGFDREKTRTVFRLTRTPDSLPSFLADLVQNQVENLDSRMVIAPTGKRSFLNYRFVPFSASSDHYFFNDGAVKVPMMMFNYSPAEFHHTNLDTPETLDTSEMKKNGFLASAVAYFVADADETDALNLAQTVASNGAARIHKSGQNGLALLRDSRKKDLHSHYAAARGYVMAAASRETKAILSTLNLCDDKTIRAHIITLVDKSIAIKDVVLDQLYLLYQYHCRRLGLNPQKILMSEIDKIAQEIIPQRCGRYLNTNWLYVLNRRNLDDEDHKFIDDFRKRLKDSYIRIPEILNFIDGKRTLREIMTSIVYEYFGFQTGNAYAGQTMDISSSYRDVRTEDLLQFMEILKKARMVDY